MSLVCSQCGSRNIDSDTARGNPACMDCGTVVATDMIISEVEFEEMAGGRHKAIGHFVGHDEIGATSLGGIHSGSKQSRQITLYNAKKRITAMVNALNMPAHVIDTAHRFYKLALEQGLTRGRKLSHVVASCLYIASRLESTPHMLLDFCDLVQANVAVVCKCYMTITTALCIRLPPTDPSILIPRFAEKLGFKDKSHSVAKTALRVAQRMKRDWLELGRRPAGLCGAALLFAARIHGFNRTIENIAMIVKMSNTTIRNRMLEFEETYAAAMTVTDFVENDEDGRVPECDPPAYKRSKYMDEVLEQELSNLDEGSFELNIKNLEKQIESEVERISAKQTANGSVRALSRFTQDVFCNNECNEDCSTVQEYIADENAQFIEQFALTDNASSKDEDKSWKILIRESITLPTGEEQDDIVSEDVKVKEELDPTDADFNDIDEYILSKDETLRKARIWVRSNADWLKKQKLKLIRKQEEEADSKINPHYKEKKQKRKVNKPGDIKAGTISEALTALIQEKKIMGQMDMSLVSEIDEAVDAEIRKAEPDQTEEAFEVVTEHNQDLTIEDEVVLDQREVNVSSEDDESPVDSEEDALMGFRGHVDSDDEY